MGVARVLIELRRESQLMHLDLKLLITTMTIDPELPFQD